MAETSTQHELSEEARQALFRFAFTAGDEDDWQDVDEHEEAVDEEEPAPTAPERPTVH